MRLAQRYSPQTLRSARRFSLLLVTGVLWVSPLAGQQQTTTIVPDVEVTLPPMQITNEITVMSDSVMIANLNRNLEALRLQIAAQECDTCGGTATVVRIGQGALVLIAGFMAWQLKRLADRPADIHTTDVNVNYEHPDHDRRKSKKGHDDDDGEGE